MCKKNTRTCGQDVWPGPWLQAPRVTNTFLGELTRFLANHNICTTEPRRRWRRNPKGYRSLRRLSKGGRDFRQQLVPGSRFQVETHARASKPRLPNQPWLTTSRITTSSRPVIHGHSPTISRECGDREVAAWRPPQRGSARGARSHDAPGCDTTGRPKQHPVDSKSGGH
jgi:hypothetical protein